MIRSARGLSAGRVKLNDKVVVDNCVFLEGKIPAEGPLMLENHRGPLWFRNIFVKELEAK